MKLKVEITAEDSIEFNYYYNWARPEKKENRMIYTLLPFCGAVLLILFTRGFNFQLYGTPELMLFFFCTLLALYMPIGVKQQTGRMVNRLLESGKSAAILGERIISIEPDKLIETTKYSYSEIF